MKYIRKRKTRRKYTRRKYTRRKCRKRKGGNGDDSPGIEMIKKTKNIHKMKYSM